RSMASPDAPITSRDDAHRNPASQTMNSATAISVSSSAGSDRPALTGVGAAPSSMVTGTDTVEAAASASATGSIKAGTVGAAATLCWIVRCGGTTSATTGRTSNVPNAVSQTTWRWLASLRNFAAPQASDSSTADAAKHSPANRSARNANRELIAL